MTIAKADILTEVNDNLQEEFAAGDIETSIQKCLDDISEEDLLVDSDSSQSLSIGDKTLDLPTGFRAMIAISLTLTGSGSEQYPLIALKGGHRQYRELRHNDDSTGIPRYYSEYDDKFYLWRPTNQAATVLIEYYKNHPQDVDNIEFADNFKNAIYAGVTYYLALKHKKTSYVQLWLPIYENAKEKRTDAIVHIPRFVRGN
jgi:hypothetical protein